MRSSGVTQSDLKVWKSNAQKYTHAELMIFFLALNHCSLSSNIFLERKINIHCIYITWIWLFSQSMDKENTKWPREKVVKVKKTRKNKNFCSTISSYYLMCNLILLLRKCLICITFRIDWIQSKTTHIHKIADEYISVDAPSPSWTWLQINE